MERRNVTRAASPRFGSLRPQPLAYEAESSLTAIAAEYELRQLRSMPARAIIILAAAPQLS